LRLLLRGRGHLAVRPGRVPERLVPGPGHRRARRRAHAGAAAGLRPRAAPAGRRTAPAARDGARRRAALLDLAPVGPAPAARGVAAAAPRSRPLRARAARTGAAPARPVTGTPRAMR